MPLMSPTAVMLFCSVDHDPGYDILHGLYSPQRFTGAHRTDSTFNASKYIFFIIIYLTAIGF
jgi:hypothetical protein